MGDNVNFFIKIKIYDYLNIKLYKNVLIFSVINLEAAISISIFVQLAAVSGEITAGKLC